MATENIRMSTRIRATLDFQTFREDLLVEDGIILKGECIAIPTSMRPDMMNHLHSSHQGLERCTLYARNTIYWPE